MAASILLDNVSTPRCIALLLILVFVNKCYCHVQEDLFRFDLEDPVQDFILCRKCGADVADAGFIINNLSPVATVIANRTLFDRQGVDVQYLTNPFGVKVSAIVVSTANCFGATEHWTSIFSWYPGYAWKPCICRHCGRQLGWMFERVETATDDRLVPTNDGFYLLILDSLVSERFTNSLIVIPKSYKS